jgi:hypothetical protein
VEKMDEYKIKRYVSVGLYDGKVGMEVYIDSAHESYKVFAVKTKPYFIYNNEKEYLTDDEIKSMNRMRVDNRNFISHK